MNWCTLYASVGSSVTLFAAPLSSTHPLVINLCVAYRYNTGKGAGHVVFIILLSVTTALMPDSLNSTHLINH